jgi:hypothetical protein
MLYPTVNLMGRGRSPLPIPPLPPRFLLRSGRRSDGDPSYSVLATGFLRPDPDLSHHPSAA